MGANEHGRPFQLAVTLGLALLVLSPLARPKGWDSFPISSYPMFSRGDLGTIVTLSHAMLVTADGRQRPAKPALVATPEPMVALALLNETVRRGTASELCTRIAARARAAGEDAAAVEIVTSTFDTSRYFATAGGATPRSGERGAPLARTLQARCELPR